MTEAYEAYTTTTVITNDLSVSLTIAGEDDSHHIVSVIGRGGKVLERLEYVNEGEDFGFTAQGEYNMLVSLLRKVADQYTLV